jgi:hypothetical protein
VAGQSGMLTTKVGGSFSVGRRLEAQEPTRGLFVTRAKAPPLTLAGRQMFSSKPLY